MCFHYKQWDKETTQEICRVKWEPYYWDNTHLNVWVLGSEKDSVVTLLQTVEH